MKLSVIVEEKKPDVCCDLDGLLAVYSDWKGRDHIGDPIVGAKEFLQKLSKIANIIILTSRVSDDKPAKEIIAKWFKKHDLPYDSIWTGTGKPKAVSYIDDRAVECVPQSNKSAFDTALEKVKKLIEKHK